MHDEVKLIDEFASGRLSRRDFVHRAAALGLAAPMVAALLAAGLTPGAIHWGKAGGTGRRPRLRRLADA
jgi:hypothetical protein